MTQFMQIMSVKISLTRKVQKHVKVLLKIIFNQRISCIHESYLTYQHIHGTYFYQMLIYST